MINNAHGKAVKNGTNNEEKTLHIPGCHVVHQHRETTAHDACHPNIYSHGLFVIHFLDQRSVSDLIRYPRLIPYIFQEARGNLLSLGFMGFHSGIKVFIGSSGPRIWMLSAKERIRESPEFNVGKDWWVGSYINFFSHFLSILFTIV